MRAKNSLKIAVNNYSLVFKNLLYKLIIFTVFAVLIRIVLSVALTPFIDKLRPVVKNVVSLITAILNGDNVESVNLAFKTSLEEFSLFFTSNAGNIVIATVIICFIIIVYKFLTGISDCTLMILVSGHMTGLSHRGYVGVMVENLKKILVYQLIDAFSTIIYSAVVGLLVWGVFRLSVITVPVMALFGTALVIILAIGLYQTVFSQVMANILIGEDRGIKKAIIDGIKPKKEFFGRMFAGYFTTTVILAYLHVTMTLFTFGVGELILIPFASLMIATMKTVDFFTIHKKKYFVDYDTIIIPKELRENDENLLSDVEI